MARTQFHGKTYVGIDNGVSGSIGIIPFTGSGARFLLTPTKSCQNFQKDAKNITRIDAVTLHGILAHVENPFAVIERPLVNPGMFSATMSAVRALEATLLVLEWLEIPHMFIDSKEWQKVMLPNGTKGPELKVASKDIGTRLFPQFRDQFKADADGLLIAEWARRERL
jgi:hypothetical protein